MYLQEVTGGQAVFSQRKAADPTGKQEGDPTKGLTFEESAVIMAGELVVEELEDCWTEDGRSVSNRNGGSHMMLDNKNEQK